MTAPAPPVVILSEAPEIALARELVDLTRRRIADAAHGAATTTEALNLGRLDEALEAASSHLFNVLNVASSHLGCSASRRAIDLRHLRAAGVEVPES